MVTVSYPKYGLSDKFLIVKETMKRKNAEWIYSYSLEMRSESTFSGRPKDDGADFFKKLGGKTTGQTSSSGVDDSRLYIQEEEPTSATNLDLWVDTNDYSMDDVQSFTPLTLLDITVNYGRVLDCGGAITVRPFSLVTESAKSTHDNPAFFLWLINTGANVVHFVPPTPETVEGITSYALAVGERKQLVGYGTDWKVIT